MFTMVLWSQCLLMTQLMTMTWHTVNSHGRLVEPPSRSSMWRYGFDTLHNYNDNAINCGGVNNQWYVNGGKCGLCGDPWEQTPPRDNEAGGRYGNGIITRHYKPGQTVDVRIDITANHRGWFEFRLCAHNSPSTPITHQCLDQHLLELADGSGTQYTLKPQVNYVDIKVRLPSGLTCTQCVLQWKWHGANNFGTDSSGRSCMGCGPVQEEFYGCSDIAIGGSGTTAPPPAKPTPSSVPRPVSSTQHTPVVTSIAQVTYPPFQPLSRPASPLPTSGPVQPVTLSSSPSVTYPSFQPLTRHTPVTLSSSPSVTYPPFQPVTRHTPVPTGHPARKPTQQSVKTYPPFQPLTMQPASTFPFFPFTVGPVSTSVNPQTVPGPCHAINKWQGIPELDRFCNEQCPLGNCTLLLLFRQGHSVLHRLAFTSYTHRCTWWQQRQTSDHPSPTNNSTAPCDWSATNHCWP